MDCAKAIGARATNPNKTIRQMRGILKVRHALPPLYAIPTTSGTGSETTLAAVIVDAHTKEKFAIEDPKLVPKYAVLDPNMTLSLPPFLTASTGMDALTHAVESFIGKSNTHETKALGHVHKPTELVERRVIYAGTPEPLEQGETGPHGIYVGDIHPITHRIQKLEFVPLAAAGYVPLQISVTERTSNEELQRLISAEIEKRGTQNIYRLRITGKHDPEVQFDLAPLRERYRIVTVEDMSEPQYDFVALYREHPSDMIGFYIRKLLRENPDDMSEIEKKALYYGIHALLQSQKGGL